MYLKVEEARKVKVSFKTCNGAQKGYQSLGKIQVRRKQKGLTYSKVVAIVLFVDLSNVIVTFLGRMLIIISKMTTHFTMTKAIESCDVEALDGATLEP